MIGKATPVLLGGGGTVPPNAPPRGLIEMEIPGGTVTRATALAVADLFVERDRQETLRRQGRFAHTLASGQLGHAERLVLLAREFGEVAQATALPVTDRRESLAQRAAGLRTELVQLAAVAVAWIEAIDNLTEESDQ